MAESAAQTRARILKERIAAAKATSGEQEKPIDTSPATENEARQLRTRHLTPKHPGEAVVRNQPMQRQPLRHNPNQRGQAKVYQKHVLFAIVSAFIIRVVAVGKLSGK